MDDITQRHSRNTPCTSRNDAAQIFYEILTFSLIPSFGFNHNQFAVVLWHIPSA